MNIEQIRIDTPYCQDKLFVNSAGSSLQPTIVLAAVKSYLDKEAQLGGYMVADTHEAEIEIFYEAVATLIGTQSSNIAFAHDATDAYLKALSAIPFQKGEVVITSQDDYSSNQIQFLSLQKRFGISIKRINTLANGDLDIAHFQELIAQKTPKLVAITHVPTNSGLIQQVEAIGEICYQKDILYLVDACQSVGQIVVDVQKIKCDFLSATGRKFLRGPRGTGFLYVSDRALAKGLSPLYIDGGGAVWTREQEYQVLPTARRFQTWEKPYALMMGLTTAIQYATTIGLANIEVYNQQLMQRLKHNLAAIPSVAVFDKGAKTCNLLTFRKGDKSASSIQKVLAEHSVFHGLSTKEWGVIDYGKKGVDWTIRLSPHYFNTLEEMDRLTEIIESI